MLHKLKLKIENHFCCNNKLQFCWKSFLEIFNSIQSVIWFFYKCYLNLKLFKDFFLKKSKWINQIHKPWLWNDVLHCDLFNTIYNKFNYANFSFMIWLKQFFGSDFISTQSNKFELLFSYTIEKNHFIEKKHFIGKKHFVEKIISSRKSFHREKKTFRREKNKMNMMNMMNIGIIIIVWN